MRLSIPGIPGVYYDTDSGSTAIGVALTAAGRKAPKPKGYAIQLLPYLWSFEVDLRDVPTDHPIQYLHPEGAQSLGEVGAGRPVREVGTELESVLRFVLSVNQTVESTTNQFLGRPRDTEGVTIEITDGTVSVDGAELETDEFDLESHETDEGTTIDIDDEVSSTDAFEDDAEEVSSTDAFEDDADEEAFDSGGER